MSKKDKKIEIQVADAKVNVGKDSFETIGKKVIGEIAELDGQFAIIKNGNVDSFYKKLEKAVEILIENYNLAK
ncbi:putative cytoplasmic protein [Streptococcus pneumoniae]|nr:putative cytoplasmic protein [Streptococcus pneumoniae]